MVRHRLFSWLAFASIFAMTLLGVNTSSFSLGPSSSSLYAQVDSFPSSSETPNEPPSGGHTVAGKARVLFFISPGCHSCPEEAAKLEEELKRLGVEYQLEGVFLGGPEQVGHYLAALRSYPFNFELGLDMDGKVTRQYGVKTFPSAVIEINGKTVIVTKASEIESKLR